MPARIAQERIKANPDIQEKLVRISKQLGEETILNTEAEPKQLALPQSVPSKNQTGTDELTKTLNDELREGNGGRKKGPGPVADKIMGYIKALNEQELQHQQEETRSLQIKEEERKRLTKERDELYILRPDLGEEFKALWGIVTKDRAISILVLLLYFVLLFFDLIPITLELFRGDEAYDRDLKEEMLGEKIADDAIEGLRKEFTDTVQGTYRAELKKGGAPVYAIINKIRHIPLPDTSALVEPVYESLPQPAQETYTQSSPQKQRAPKTKRKKFKETPRERLFFDLETRGVLVYEQRSSQHNKYPEIILRRSDSSIVVTLSLVSFPLTHWERQTANKRFKSHSNNKLIIIEENKLAKSYDYQLRRILLAFKEVEADSPPPIKHKLVRLPNGTERGR
jgi:Domain of unknown function (DUF4407)